MTTKYPEAPSAGVLLDAVLAERETRLGSIDALTNKAGILLGFTGAIVALTVLFDGWWPRALVFIPASFTVFFSLMTMRTVKLPGLGSTGLRKDLLMQSPLAAQLQMLDYFVGRHDLLAKTVEAKARFLTVTKFGLTVTIGALAFASLMEGLQ